MELSQNVNTLINKYLFGKLINFFISGLGDSYA
jgi:hypothetical protein